MRRPSCTTQEPHAIFLHFSIVSSLISPSPLGLSLRQTTGSSMLLELECYKSKCRMGHPRRHQSYYGRLCMHPTSVQLLSLLVALLRLASLFFSTTALARFKTRMQKSLGKFP